jgi:glucose-1-phosphate thymidylyltransferase
MATTTVSTGCNMPTRSVPAGSRRPWVWLSGSSTGIGCWSCWPTTSLRPLVERFAEQDKGARILLARIADAAHLRHLGVAELDEHGRVVRVVEKPEDPPSSLAVTGIYCYDATVFDVIPTLAPSGRGELEISDVNNWFLAQGTLSHDVLDGYWGDAGESIDTYYAVNDFVRHHGANKD